MAVSRSDRSWAAHIERYKQKFFEKIFGVGQPAVGQEARWNLIIIASLSNHFMFCGSSCIRAILNSMHDFLPSNVIYKQFT